VGVALGLMNRPLPWLAIGLAAPAFAGCYAAHERVSPDAWARSIARAVCETRDACPRLLAAPLGGRALDDFGDVELCLSDGVGADVVRDLARWTHAIEVGDAEIDVAALPACLDAIHDATCGAAVMNEYIVAPFPPVGAGPWLVGTPGLLGFDERCDAMFVRLAPEVADGEPCDGPLDCADGSICGHTDAGLRCRPYDEVGGACGLLLGADCFGPGRVCIEHVCLALERRRSAPIGAACGLLASSGIDERCAPGGYCSSSGVGGAICRSAGGEGAPCIRDDVRAFCAPPFVCGAVSGARDGTCVRVEHATEVGATCWGDPARGGPVTCDGRAGLLCTSRDASPGECRSSD
jgi:hypothetical protein